MDSSRDRESVLRCRRERYRLQRERETRREGSEISQKKRIIQTSKSYCEHRITRVPTLRLFGVGGNVLTVQVLSTSQNPIISDGNCYNEQYQCELSVKASAYITLVRPILEYASIVWDPHQQYLIDNIEMIQRRAVRWVKQDYRLISDVSDMMNDLQWPTLYERRKYCRLITFHKFLHQNPPDINIPRHYLHHSLSHFTRLSHHH